MGNFRSENEDLLSKANKDATLKKIHQTIGYPLTEKSLYSSIVFDSFGEDSPAFTGLVAVESGSTDQLLEKSDVSPEIGVVLTSNKSSTVTVNCEGVYFT